MNTGMILISLVVVPNIVGFVLMGIDKHQAIMSGFRVPEATLFCMALIGGSLGCLAGMFIFHHKIRKIKFMVGMPAILGLQLLCAFLIWRSGMQFRLYW